MGSLLPTYVAVGVMVNLLLREYTPPPQLLTHIAALGEFLLSSYELYKRKLSYHAEEARKPGQALGAPARSSQRAGWAPSQRGCAAGEPTRDS